jgi:HEAT repeat protein
MRSEAATAVRWLLQQAEPEARRVAVQQIAKVGEADAAELLLSALGDEDWRVRKEAIALSPSLGRRGQIVSSLVAALKDTVNIGLRNAAVEALVAIGPDSVGETVGALPWLDADARKLAIEVLGGVADARCTTALTRALGDDDINVRVAAAEALGNAALAGEEARELATRSLLVALGSGAAFVQIAVLESLGRLEARLPWSVFEPYANDPLLRRYAIAAASGSREPDAVWALANATGDPSPTVAREAIVALGELVATLSLDSSLLDVAREALRATPAAKGNARKAVLDADDVAARSGALPLLGLLGDADDVGLLVRALGEDAAERADLGLRLFGPDAVGPLLTTAGQATPSVRAAALELAASLEGEDGANVHAAVRAALADPSVEVVACALETLGSIGDSTDLRNVASVIAHHDERVAAAATNTVWMLAKRHVDAARDLLGEGGASHDRLALGCILLGAIASMETLRDAEVEILERALAHELPKVRRAAIEALAQTGGERAADAVVFALADEDHDVQLAAVRALGSLGRTEPLVSVVADTRDPALTAAALRALGDADPARAVSAGSSLVTHPDGAIACAAVEAIGRSAGAPLPTDVAAAGEDALFSALDHTDPEVVKCSLALVGARPGARAQARLGLCLDHPSWEVRRLAAEVLGQDKGAGAQALLRARYERERDPIVREAIGAAASLRPLPAGDIHQVRTRTGAASRPPYEEGR